MVELNDKQKLAIYKKSQISGHSTGILEEVYRRGYNMWDESFNGNPEQFGFDRVNSFIAGGFASELDADLLEKRGLWDNIHAKRKRIAAGSGERMRKPGSEGAPTDAALKASQNEEADPCWTGYKQIGMKMKKGKKVPNCVPEEYTGAEKVSKDKNDPSSRFEGTTSYTNILAQDTPGQSSLLKAVKKVVFEATYKGKKVPLNKPMKGDVKKSKVFVDPDGDGKAQKVNFGDKNMSIKKDQPGRKRSYCARSGGQGNLTDKTSANYWSRKAWDC
jgi:hypothetical protein